jgi:hypothetical protein
MDISIKATRITAGESAPPYGHRLSTESNVIFSAASFPSTRRNAIRSSGSRTGGGNVQLLLFPADRLKTFLPWVFHLRSAAAFRNEDRHDRGQFLYTQGGKDGGERGHGTLTRFPLAGKELAIHAGTRVHPLCRHRSRLETDRTAPVGELGIIGDIEMLTGKTVDLRFPLFPPVRAGSSLCMVVLIHRTHSIHPEDIRFLG